MFEHESNEILFAGLRWQRVPCGYDLPDPEVEEAAGAPAATPRAQPPVLPRASPHRVSPASNCE